MVIEKLPHNILSSAQLLFPIEAATVESSIRNRNWNNHNPRQHTAILRLLRRLFFQLAEKSTIWPTVFFCAAAFFKVEEVAESPDENWKKNQWEKI